MTSPSYLPPTPNFFTGRGNVLATHANLPHWSKANTASFVTFRLCDSLPQEKLNALIAEREIWLANHPQPWDDATTREYFETFDGTVQHWLDKGYGSCLLRDERCRKVVGDALQHFNGERYALYAYVVMPNHVHVLFMPLGENVLRDIVASWKRFTAREINRILDREGMFWQKESFDTLVRSERHFETIMRYIKRNDLERAWTWRPSGEAESFPLQQGKALRPLSNTVAAHGADLRVRSPAW